MNDPILILKNLTKEFPGVKALNAVSFEIERGSVHALLGENGAGKSTLIKIIAGVYLKNDGEIILNGIPCDFTCPADAFRRGLSVIHQETSLIPELTVLQNVFLGIEVRSRRLKVLKEKWMLERYRTFCDKINFHIDPEIQARDLSVAQKKIVEILKALVRETSLIIMDEPTDSLTGKEIEHLYMVIRDLKRHGVTVIYITHYMDEVFEITDRATVMKDGAHVLTETTKDLTPGKIISAMVGRDMAGEVGANGSGAGDRPQGKPAMEVRHLTAADRIEDISFVARYGEVLGITGVIGSGKTELARALFGADRIDSGKIYVNGKRVRHSHPLEALNNGIGMLPEDRKTQGLLLEQEVYKNITLCDLQKNNRRLLNKGFEYEQSRKMVKALNIKISGLDHQVMFLSGGNQQKVVLAKWLLANPDIIILDEPTRGIDVGAKGEIYKIMKDLARQGKCIIFISSEVPEIITVADRILLMKQGRITDRFENGAGSKELFHAMLEDKE